MRKGELTTRPQPVCAVDYRILVEPKYGYGWFTHNLPQMLWAAGMEDRIRRLLPIRKGAKWWLERNWEHRFCAVTVAQPLLIPSIKLVLGDYVAEFEHFADPGELSVWLRQTPEVESFYTVDPALLGLDERIRPFHGWGEKL